MKTTAIILALCTANLSLAAKPEQEKAFLAEYQKAFEAGDAAKLLSFLHTKGSTPAIIEFFTMMQTAEAGQKISRIELVTPTVEELAKFDRVMEMDGVNYQLPVKASKQLVVVVETKDGSSTGKSTQKSPVAEVAGRLVIPLPVPAQAN
jgi:hypothetical protein